MNNFKNTAVWLAIGILIMFPLFYVDWEGEPEYPELEGAVRVVRYLSSKRNIKQSSFLVYYPKGKATDFVNWMFSGAGKAEWPPIKGGLEPDLEEGTQAIGIPLTPKEVRLVAITPDKKAKKQVVVTADDAQGLIRVDGYLDPLQAPVFSKEWTLTLPGKQR